MTERLDGNAIAGVAFALFGQEMTLATGVCRFCGKPSIVAELHVYVAAGLVARCPACEAVVLRIVEGPERAWLDLSGLATLEMRQPRSA
jgi:Family of unknown function (DUF6510)